MKVVLFANTDWYLYNFRLPLAERLRTRGDEVLLLSPPGEYGPRLVEMGFRWQALPMDRRSLNPLKEARLLARLAAILRRERPDIVHGFTLKAAIYGSLAARVTGVRGRVNSVVGMGYVFISDEPRARLLRPIVRRLLKLALDGQGARLILQNPDDVELFRRAGLVDPDRVRLIEGSGVNCSRFTPGTSERDPCRPLEVLLPARLLWDKGVGEFVEAARALKAESRNIRFLISGDLDPGNPASVPAEVVRGWVAEGVVEWLGHVADMPALLSRVNLVVLPSYREGLPKTLIEAAACARPIITTDAPGCRQVVSHGEDGLLVPVGDAGALRQAIERLADDPALALRFGAAARRKAMERFDEEIVLSRTLAVYAEFAAPRG
ncbi:MAG TPA: glycosyltransferase family 4 protein [Caulobacteraceae bacterium]|nr:glycosyltransferase family 4 protein [Caulobacteraceae bacterium]